jgi:hypothetical protein
MAQSLYFIGTQAWCGYGEYQSRSSESDLHDDNAARGYLESVLWPAGPFCPRCGVTGDRITKLQGKSTRPGVYNCKDCRKPFSVTVGTVMERSHIPPSKWLLAACRT